MNPPNIVGELTQTASHSAFWHYVEPVSPGLALSPHNSDKPLISLHFCLLPVHVGSESKQRGVERGGSVSLCVSWELETAGTGPGVAVPVLDNKMVGTCESTDEGIVDLGYEHKPSLLYGALTFPYKFQLPLIVDGDAAMIGHRGSFSRDGESWRTYKTSS